MKYSFSSVRTIEGRIASGPGLTLPGVNDMICFNLLLTGFW